MPKGGSKVYAIFFLYNKCSTFAAACVCGQSYASISHTPPSVILNTASAGSLPLKACSFSCLFLMQWCRDAASESTLRPTNWDIGMYSNNSTGPHKPMNINRDSLLAKITWGYLKWLRAYGRNYYVHQHPSTCVFAKYS